MGSANIVICYDGVQDDTAGSQDDDTDDDCAVDEMTVIIWFMSVKLVQHTKHSLTMTRTCQLHRM